MALTGGVGGAGATGGAGGGPKQGKAANAEAVAHYTVRVRALGVIASRLQRTWRARAIGRAMRLSNRRHRAASRAQAIVRGRYARLYVEARRVCRHSGVIVSSLGHHRRAGRGSTSRRVVVCVVRHAS